MTKPTKAWVEEQAKMREFRAEKMAGMASEHEAPLAAILRWALDSRALLEEARSKYPRPDHLDLLDDDAMSGKRSQVGGTHSIARLRAIDAHLAATPWVEA